MSAKHVFKNQGGTPESLRVFPSDKSRNSIPFDALAVIHLDGTEDESYKDLYLLKIAIEKFRTSGDDRLVTIDLDRGCARLKSISEGDKMLLIGFPSEVRGVDYERSRISYARKLLEAEFVGASMMSNCFDMRLKDTGGLTDLDGYSGSPVFHWEANHTPRLAGVMITGTISSGICHFIGVHVLESAIKKAVAT